MYKGNMHRRDHHSEDTKICKSPKTISEMQYGSRGDKLDNKIPNLRWSPVPRDGMAVGIKSGKRWQSGCWDKEWQTLAVWL